MRRSILVLIGVASLGQAQTWQVGQSVQTNTGKVIGKASSWKNQVSEYLGVPFAKPPVGDLRWAAPQALEKDSSKVIEATKFVIRTVK
jgi:carboxylesterase type B